MQPLLLFFEGMSSWKLRRAWATHEPQISCLLVPKHPKFPAFCYPNIPNFLFFGPQASQISSFSCHPETPIFLLFGPQVPQISYFLVPKNPKLPVFLVPKRLKCPGFWSPNISNFLFFATSSCSVVRAISGTSERV